MAKKIARIQNNSNQASLVIKEICKDLPLKMDDLMRVCMMTHDEVIDCLDGGQDSIVMLMRISKFYNLDTDITVKWKVRI
jgi:hypothetical protein